MRERLEGDVAPPSAVIRGLGPLDHVILRCLARDPSDRYRDMRELLRDIRDLENRFGGENGSTCNDNA